MKQVAAPDGDPFGERIACCWRTRATVLGGVFEFESNDASLLQLVDSVYAGLPAHTFSADPPYFRIRLLLSHDAREPTGDEAPPVRLHSGGGLLCGTMDAANFAMLSPTERTGLVAVSRSMLVRHAHAVRYELIEFAVYTLASRAQQLVSLHAACVGYKQRALLLVGDGGAGKSTLTLHCLLRGMDLIAEDAVLVEPGSRLATGIGTFLHLRTDSLESLSQPRDEALVRSSAVIRRRSGVEKFAVDLRRTHYRIAQTPVTIAGVIFLSTQRVTERAGPLLKPLRKSEFVERLTVNQPYAANQPLWDRFLKQLSDMPAFELRRGEHPGEGVEALRRLIE